MSIRSLTDICCLMVTRAATDKIGSGFFNWLRGMLLSIKIPGWVTAGFMRLCIDDFAEFFAADDAD